MTGNKREENPPRLPTPIRAALASARKKFWPPEQSADQKKNMLVKFDRTTEEVNNMAAHDVTTPIKNMGKNQATYPKSDKGTAVPLEKELVYGIERLNLGDPAVDLESDYE